MRDRDKRNSSFGSSVHRVEGLVERTVIRRNDRQRWEPPRIQRTDVGVIVHNIHVPEGVVGVDHMLDLGDSIPYRIGL
jgi:hypothetical protein